MYVLRKVRSLIPVLFVCLSTHGSPVKTLFPNIIMFKSLHDASYDQLQSAKRIKYCPNLFLESYDNLNNCAIFDKFPPKSVLDHPVLALCPQKCVSKYLRKPKIDRLFRCRSIYVEINGRQIFFSFRTHFGMHFGGQDSDNLLYHFESNIQYFQRVQRFDGKLQKNRT
jgi:hypothetical protein